MTPFLSLCMIVKNEEDCLQKCLSSVQGLVDEIIVIDTGSTDRTVEIANQYTENIYSFEWVHDFSKARNTSIRHATGKWILILDADEYVDPHFFTALKSYLSEMSTSLVPTGIITPIYNYVGQLNNGKISESAAIRIFSNHPDIGFERPIHEQLVRRGGNIQILHYDFPIFHTGYTEQVVVQKNKSARNLAIMNQMNKDNQFLPYDSYTLGNEYFMKDDYETALSFYLEARRPSEYNKTWFPTCTGNTFTCYMKMGQYFEALELTSWAQRKWPKKGDFLWMEGYLYEQIGLESKAIKALQEATAMDYLISPNYVTTLPLQLLSSLHLRGFDTHQAVRSLTSLCYANPNQYGFVYELLRLISKGEDLRTVQSIILSIYNEPSPSQSLMILDAAIALGLSELADVYYQYCFKLNASIPMTTLLHFALSKDDWNSYNRLLSKLSVNIQIDLPVLYAGFMNWPDYGNRFGSFQALFSSIDDTSVMKACMILFRFQKYEAYDRIIQKHAKESGQLVNLLGDAFFKDQQYELALEYYSILLNKKSMAAKGYENLARLYFYQNDIDEGLEFLEQAIRITPGSIHLYILHIQYSHGEKQQTIKNALLERFPSFAGHAKKLELLIQGC